MNKYIKSLETPIAIVGMGRSGESAKKLLLACGIKAEHLFTFDEKNVAADFKNGPELMSKISPRTLVVSPGYPLKTSWVKEAQSRGIHITSEITLANSFLTTEKLIGVTGSLGKSTTVSLLGAALDAFSKTGFVGGNLGTPFCDYALALISGQRPVADWVVLELSSYQLENTHGLKLDHSAITFLSPNHLERYESLQHYYEMKWSVAEKTSGLCYLNKAGGDLVSQLGSRPDPQKFKLVSPLDLDLQKFSLSEAALLGQHNLENISLAAALALGAGWPESAIEALKKFSGLSHRLENLGTLQGVLFINDSKATALDSVLIAVQAAQAHTKKTLHILLGGRDKNLPWQDLSSLNSHPQRQFYFFGECRDIAKAKTNLPGEVYENMTLAVTACLAKSEPGDTVLLSPGGTSLDEFKSFEERGDVFKRLVLGS